MMANTADTWNAAVDIQLGQLADQLGRQVGIRPLVWCAPNVGSSNASSTFTKLPGRCGRGTHREPTVTVPAELTRESPPDRREVVGHEVAHLALGHGWSRWIDCSYYVPAVVGWLAAVVLMIVGLFTMPLMAGPPVVSTVLFEVSMWLTVFGYVTWAAVRRRREYAADAYAARVFNAPITPSGAEAMRREEPRLSRVCALRLLRTHPLPEQRLARMERIDS